MKRRRLWLWPLLALFLAYFLQGTGSSCLERHKGGVAFWGFSSTERRGETAPCFLRLSPGRPSASLSAEEHRSEDIAASPLKPRFLAARLRKGERFRVRGVASTPQSQAEDSCLAKRLKEASSDFERLQLLSRFAQQATAVDAVVSEELFADAPQPHPSKHIRACQWGVLFQDKAFARTPWKCVAGCTAHVYVQLALLRTPLSGASSERSALQLREAPQPRPSAFRLSGLSDSLLVGGLLALLASHIERRALSLEDSRVELASEELLTEWGLRSLLPSERVRGFRKVAEAVEAQRRLLEEVAEKPSENTQHQGRGSRPRASMPRASPVGDSAREEAKISTEVHRSLDWTGQVSAQLRAVVSEALEALRREACERRGESLAVEENALSGGRNLLPRALPWTGGVGEEVSVLLSGGVDSSTSLQLLQKAGLRVRAFFLKVWSPEAEALLAEEGAPSCPWKKDAEAARAAAAHAGVALEEIPMQKEYRKRVLEAMLEEAKRGLTPNPDWWCNSRVKFGAFLEALGEQDGAGASLVASGHYAKVLSTEEGRVALLRGADCQKDQSYFLSGLNAQQLRRLLLPLGPLTKSQVRQVAAAHGLPSATRPDSQGLCFLGKLRLGSLLLQMLGKDKGPVVHLPSGAVVGSHNGLFLFTEGQRRGVVPLIDCQRLRFAQMRDRLLPPPSTAGPWLVAGKLREENALFVVSEAEARAALEFARTLQGSSSQSAVAGEALLAKALKAHSAAQLAVLLSLLRSRLLVSDIRLLDERKAQGLRERLSGWRSCETIAEQEAFALRHAARLAVQGGRMCLQASKDASIANSQQPLVVQVRHGAGCEGPVKHRVIPLACSAHPPGEEATLAEPLEGTRQDGVSPTLEADLLLCEADVGLAGGQVVAFYEGEECVGAGRVSHAQGQALLRKLLQGGPLKALRSAAL